MQPAMSYGRCRWGSNRPTCKLMSSIGIGVKEIRVHVLGEWCVIYVAKFADAIYVLHAFQKKTQKTRQEDIELARRRFWQIGG